MSQWPIRQISLENYLIPAIFKGKIRPTWNLLKLLWRQDSHRDRSADREKSSSHLERFEA